MKFKSKKIIVLMALLMVTSIAFIGCGGDDEPAPNGEAGEVQWPRTIDIGSASIGGVYYVYAGGLANVISEEVGVAAGVEVTGGPNHNMQLVDMNDLDLGLVTMGPAWEAWHGEGDWTGGIEHRNVRAIFPMYTTYSQWWAFANSGIDNIYDLEGVTVGVGPAGGTGGTYHPRFLDVLGIDATVVHAGLGDLVQQHLDRQLGANSFSSGLPVGGLLETSNSRDVVFFGIGGEDREKILEAYPYWSPAVIPADVPGYDFLTEDVDTVGIWNVAIANKDLPDDFVYEIVKAVMENNDRMVDTHVAAKETIADNVVHNDWMWMHPGAIKYFEEQGYELNPNVYPPEWE
ncbi:hypothetical protein GGQ84_001022 [Desulfitispora alkaliphila]|uniref:TAXI family TRAP transporter solute-binding subunit n=1 Tax=Desulfitispora alkaliphila TaxID=622674 RepID=UPI003D23350C